MRIGIDCRCLTMRPTGVSKYLADAIIAISKYIPSWELILFAPSEFHEAVLPIEGKKVKKVVCPLPFLNKHLFWFNTMYVYQCSRFHVDIMWSPVPVRPIFTSSRIKKMITIHDVVALEYNETTSNHNRFLGNGNFKKSILKTDLIWCNSNYTHGKINEYFPNRNQKNVIIGDSCSELFRRKEYSVDYIKKIKKSFGIDGRFLLFVGTLEPRKNLIFLLEIMRELHKRDPNLKLLVVGGSGWKNSNIRETIEDPSYPSDAVIFAGYVEIETLKTLYCIADCFVSAAINEGFGMPQLEAMRCGCPVVTSHNSAMIEVVGGRGTTVKGYNVNEWSDAIEKAICLDRPIVYDLMEYEWASIVSKLNNYINENIKSTM